MNNVNETILLKKEYNFYLDWSLINLDILKHIGFEKLTGSIVVETNHDTITQKAIHLDDFTKDTIIPVWPRLEDIVLDLQNKEEKCQN
jgi:hypothetical protein